jgi:hypothetical protein
VSFGQETKRGVEVVTRGDDALARLVRVDGVLDARHRCSLADVRHGGAGHALGWYRGTRPADDLSYHDYLEQLTTLLLLETSAPPARLRTA